MAQVQEVVGGAHFATSYSGIGTALTGLTRANLSAGAANAVVVNDGAGLLSDIAFLDAMRGGTGIDSSALTGLARITAGVWSAGAVIVNADIDAAAAIARSKLANGTANHVVINGPGGVMTSEALLATSRGGTGVDLSVVVGPAVLTVTGGAVSTIDYSQLATPLTLAQRDASGRLLATSHQSSTDSQSNVLLPYSGSVVTLGSGAAAPFTIEFVTKTDRITQFVNTVGKVETFARQLTTLNNTPTSALAYATVTGSGYTVQILAIGRRPDTGNVATFRTLVRAKNTAGVVTTTNVELTRSREVGLATTTVQPVAAGVTLDVQVTGMAAVTINWTVEVTVLTG
jgi:hypothetical protein